MSDGHLILLCADYNNKIVLQSLIANETLYGVDSMEDLISSYYQSVGDCRARVFAIVQSTDHSYDAASFSSLGPMYTVPALIFYSFVPKR